MAPPRMDREWVRPEDKYWWRSEEPTDLMTIHSALLLDERLELDEFKAWLSERTAAIRRFRDRLVVPKSRFALPYWEPYAEFNIDEHVQLIELDRRLKREDIAEFVGGMLCAPLDYSKPPWEMYLLQGEGQKCAVVSRVHHVMGDGLALIQLLLDFAGENPPAPPQEDDADSGFVSNLLAPARRGMRTGVKLVKTGARIAAHPRRSVTWSIDAAAEWAWTLALQPDPQTCLKGEPGIGKRAAWARTLDLGEVRAIGRDRGATVNDVVLTLLTGALRRYLKERGQDLGGEEIGALLPVNVRPDGSPPTLDNTFGMLGLSLPIQIADPLERLDEMHARTTELKDSAAPSANYVLMSGLGLGPKLFQDWMTEIVKRRWSILVTNVPGPSEPVRIAGKPVSNLVFWVPGAGKMGVVVGVISYAGKLNVTLSSDVRRVPDPEAIARGFEAEFAALCKH